MLILRDLARTAGPRRDDRATATIRGSWRASSTRSYKSPADGARTPLFASFIEAAAYDRSSGVDWSGPSSRTVDAPPK